MSQQPQGSVPTRPPRRLARGTVSEQLADQLVTAIAVGAYSPGDRLPPERDLAAQLRVSRVTVREAIRTVSALGLLTTRRGRDGGTFVTAADWLEIAPETARRTLETELPRLRDLFDYRCLVEGMIAGAAAERRTRDDAAELERALADFRLATDSSRARLLDRRLHGLVSRAARNPHLIALSAQLTAEATMGFGSEPYTPAFLAQAGEEHVELVGHVIRGDEDAANRSAQRHFSMTLEIMRDALRRASAGDGTTA